MIGYPRNGEDLLRLRREGMRPDGVVLVSMVGSLPHANYTLYADATTPCDWSMLAGLDVDLIVSRSIPFRLVLRALAALADACPAQMAISYIEGPCVDCGQARYVPLSVQPLAGRMMFDWYPLAVGRDAQGIALERSLWRELGNGIPTHSDTAIYCAAEQLDKEIARGIHHS